MAEERERFACAVCGRLATVRMGDRGPVKVPLVIERIGNFLFCSECLAQGEVYDRPAGAYTEHVVLMWGGSFEGHTWITGVSGG